MMNAVEQLELPQKLREFLETDESITFFLKEEGRASDQLEDVRVEVSEDFEAVQTFKQVHDKMPPVGSYARIILDFSDSKSFSLSELSHFLIELLWHPRYEKIDLVFEGLQL